MSLRISDLAQGLEDHKLPAYQVPIRDSIDTARGYRMIDELWSCVPDSVYPWNPDVLRGIWQVAPDTVPLWRMSVFYRPNTRDIVVFGRHALGRYIERPGYDLTPFHVLMPTMPCLGVSFPRPNKVWFVHEGNRNPDYPDIPGTYLGFDDTIEHRARASVGNLPTMSEAEVRKLLRKEMLDDQIEARARRKAALEDDMEQRRKDIAPYAQRMMDSVSDSEIEAFQRSVGQRDRATRPMVQVGDYPRGE